MLKYVKSQRRYGFLITKELIFGFQILDLKDHSSASLKFTGYFYLYDIKIHDKVNTILEFSCSFYCLFQAKNDIILICKWINISMLRHRKSHRGFKLEILSLPVRGSRKAFLTLSRITKTSRY